MRRMHLLILSLLTSIPAGLVGGCAAENPTTLFIIGNAAPAEGCVYDDSQDGAKLLSPGILDLDFATSYTIHPVVLNGTQGRNGEPVTQSFASFTGAHVEINAVNSDTSHGLIDPLGDSFAIRDTEDCSGGADADDTGVCAVQVLDFDQTAALAGGAGNSIVAHVQVEATVRGTEGVLSSIFQWQINLCRGCLVSVYEGPCADVQDELGSPACHVGQDLAQLCCGVGTPKACFYRQ
jgi:hypothetical protein